MVDCPLSQKESSLEKPVRFIGVRARNPLRELSFNDPFDNTPGGDDYLFSSSSTALK
jgi:hypothetical protein